MSFSTMLSDAANTVLTVKTTYAEDRTNIPNNAQLLSLCPAVQAVADVIGIDLKEAEFTFTVNKAKSGYVAYQPYVASRNNQACLVWGKISKPLADIPAMELEQDDKKPVFTLEANGELYKFPIMFPKDAAVDYATVKKAFKSGSLANFLAKGFEKGKKISTLEAGDYTVSAVRDNTFNGEVNYDIFIDGEGWYKANSKIKRRLDSGMIIDAENPASLTLHGVVSQTSAGYDIMGLDFMSAVEVELPAFVF